MNLVFDALYKKLSRHKNTPSRFLKFNGPCCPHVGAHRLDDRQRAGMKINLEDNSFVYHCFNCKFIATWTPGKMFSQKIINLLSWFGYSEIEINQMNFQAWRQQEQKKLKIETGELFIPKFDSYNLPKNTKPILELINEDPINPNVLAAVEYLSNRYEKIFDYYDFYYSPTSPYQNSIIIPFYWKKKIVGYASRNMKHGIRYGGHKPTNFIFNNNVLYDYSRKYVILSEGVFDAILSKGISTLGGTINKAQISWINSCYKEIIVVPDRDKDGSALANAAKDNNWYVSFPPWNDGIKDIADAVQKYGILFTITSIIEYKTKNKLEISLLTDKYCQ